LDIVVEEQGVVGDSRAVVVVEEEELVSDN